MEASALGISGHKAHTVWGKVHSILVNEAKMLRTEAMNEKAEESEGAKDPKSKAGT